VEILRNISAGVKRCHLCDAILYGDRRRRHLAKCNKARSALCTTSDQTTRLSFWSC